MIGLIRWIISLAILAMWCALIGTGLYVAMYEAPKETPAAQAIVVLGGNGPENGALTGESAERMAHALSLHQTGVAPTLVLTGGGAVPVAPVMAEAALAAEVAEDALLIDPASTSTLQNALFTADFEALDKTQPIILVSQRYHLPRAWASFRWAGFETVHLSATDADAGFTVDQRLLWEAVKWPLNILRAGAASAAMAADVPRDTWLQYLK
ncbi:MAG: YdcF family protein [Paracoccaceae bacterium]